jgi:hypothetical protein
MFFKLNRKEWYWKMKNKLILALGVLLVSGFVFMSCDNGTGEGDDVFEGTWVSTGQNALRIEASGGSWNEYMVSNNKEFIRGTYTVSDNVVTAKLTQINAAPFGGSDEWVAWTNLSDTYKEYVGESTQQITINGNTFTAFNGWTFTKQ